MSEADTGRTTDRRKIVECLFPLGVTITVVQSAVNQLPGYKFSGTQLYAWIRELGLKRPEFVPDTVSYHGITISAYMAKRWTEERIELMSRLIPTYLSWNEIGARLSSLPGDAVSGYEAQSFLHRFFPGLKRPSDLRQHKAKLRNAAREAAYGYAAAKVEPDVFADECDAAFERIVEIEDERTKLSLARDSRLLRESERRMAAARKDAAARRKQEYEMAIADANERRETIQKNETKQPPAAKSETATAPSISERKHQAERIRLNSQSGIAETVATRRASGTFVPQDAPNVLPTARADPAKKNVPFGMSAMTGRDLTREAMLRKQIAEGARGRV